MAAAEAVSATMVQVAQEPRAEPEVLAVLERLGAPEALVKQEVPEALEPVVVLEALAKLEAREALGQRAAQELLEEVAPLEAQVLLAAVVGQELLAALVQLVVRVQQVDLERLVHPGLKAHAASE